MKNALLLIFALFISCHSFGQGRWIDHKSQAALPSTNVRDVLVDSKGNKWFATSNGLSKFDGTSWTTYKAAYLQLQSNDIKALAEDKSGRIWVVTAQDVEVYDGENWTYYNENDGLLAGAYQSIKADAGGNVWLGHMSGLTLFNGSEFSNITKINGNDITNIRDVETDANGNTWFSYMNAATNRANVALNKDNSWIVYGHENFGEAAFYPLKLSFADGKIWAGAYQGFYYFQENAFYRFDITTETPNPDLMGGILEDAAGDLWFIKGAAAGGAFKYTPSTGSWADYNMNNAAITSAALDGNQIWFGCETSGVVKVNATTNSWQSISTTYGLSTNDVKKVFIGSPGVPWIGGASSDNMRYYFDKLIENSWERIQFPFYLYNVLNIFEDVQGRTWIADGSRVHALHQGNWTTYTSTNSLLPDQQMYAAATDLDGNSYFTFQNQGTMQGTVIMYNGTRWYDITSSHANLNGFISKIVATSDGKVWFFSSRGTVVKDGNQWIADESYPQNPESAVADKNGGLWLGYLNKVVHYAAGTVTEHSLSHLLVSNISDPYSKGYFIKALAMDYKGNVWAGGFSMYQPEGYPGLLRYDGSSWRTYSKSDGLISDAVNTIETDESGNVWIGTQNGLSQLILFSETVTVSTTNISCHGGNDGSITLTPEGYTPPYLYSIDGGKTFVSDNAFQGLTAGNYHVIVKDGDGLTAHDEVITLTQPVGVFTWEVTPVSCAGARDGAIKLTVQHGGTPISFQWYRADGSPIANANTQNIAAISGGTYKVVAMYGNCTITKQIVVPEPQPLQATVDYLNSCVDAGSGQITVKASGGTAPYKYSIDGGITFQTQKTFPDAAVGLYQVLIQDANNCTFTTEAITIEQKEAPAPVIVANGDLALCAGSSVILATTQEYDSYAWYDNSGNLLSTEANLEVTQAGTFHVVVYQGQCQAASAAVTATVAATYDQQQVCIVTVDTATGKNKIIWSKTEGQSVTHYNIYKETGTNQYSLIGNVAFDANNFFIDSDSDPMKASERYRISIVDKCGRESALSPAHKTIYLQASLGVNNSINLSWDTYEGFTYAQVNVLRGSSTDTLKLLATRPANSNTYTDTNPTSTQMIYVIEAVTNYTCEETSGGAANENLRLEQQNAFTRSNPSSAKALGLEDDILASAGLEVFPNPSASNIYIESKNGKLIQQVRLLDLSGRVIQELTLKGGKKSVVLERKAKAGLYILEMQDSQAQTYRKRVILQ